MERNSTGVQTPERRLHVLHGRRRVRTPKNCDGVDLTVVGKLKDQVYSQSLPDMQY